jgi:hypothetical protein
MSITVTGMRSPRMERTATDLAGEARDVSMPLCGIIALEARGEGNCPPLDSLSVLFRGQRRCPLGARRQNGPDHALAGRIGAAYLSATSSLCDQFSSRPVSAPKVLA